ncbi:Hypothetical protein POVR1_LOCUS511 [uncultured virus]|nr:Hypothetical protein POVR1_LOCUS511 [uncultured virus]
MTSVGQVGQPLGSDSGLYSGVIAARLGRNVPINRGKGSKQLRDPDGADLGNNKTSAALMVVVILITIVIFAVVISFYDVAREKIILRRTLEISRNINVAPTPDDVDRIRVTARASYRASIDFAIFATLVAVVTLPILFCAYSRL